MERSTNSTGGISFLEMDSTPLYDPDICSRITEAGQRELPKIQDILFGDKVTLDDTNPVNRLAVITFNRYLFEYFQELK